MKNKKRLRLSYSLLLTWSSGRIQDALDLYFHRDTRKTKAMEEGLVYHKKWENEVNNKKTLTLNSTILKFSNPITELKRIVQYNDLFDLSGTFDILDGNTLFELKSGVLSSLEYGSGYQLPIYFLIGELLHMKIEKGIICHYNQHNNKTDITQVWNNSRQIDKAKNIIDSIAPEIYQYFIDNNLSFLK